jgi:hypothetical protein
MFHLDQVGIYLPDKQQKDYVKKKVEESDE